MACRGGWRPWGVECAEQRGGDVRVAFWEGEPKGAKRLDGVSPHRMDPGSGLTRAGDAGYLRGA